MCNAFSSLAICFLVLVFVVGSSEVLALWPFVWSCVLYPLSSISTKRGGQKKKKHKRIWAGTLGTGRIARALLAPHAPREAVSFFDPLPFSAPARVSLHSFSSPLSTGQLPTSRNSEPNWATVEDQTHIFVDEDVLA